MKTLIFLGMLLVFFVFLGKTCYSQTSDVTVEVEGISHEQGHLMIVAVNVNTKQTSYERLPVAKKNKMLCSFKKLSLGKVNIYGFHDLNGNFDLDRDEKGIPTEPCFTEENVEITENMPNIKVKLVDFSKKKKPTQTSKQ